MLILNDSLFTDFCGDGLKVSFTCVNGIWQSTDLVVVQDIIENSVLEEFLL
jgi:hypothetical protein